METILKLDGISKSYKEFTLNSVTLGVERGTIVGMIGPNGAGKTTTLKIVMNMVRANEGSVTVFGKDHIHNEREVKNQIGYVGEEQIFYEDKTVAWTGKFVGKFYDTWNINTYGNLLHEFGISGTKKIKDLSKGMKVKLSLALALAHDPELIILDEPTAGLDPVVRRELLDKLRNLVTADQQKAVLFSSHITDDLARTADVIVYLVNGRIVMTNSKDELHAGWKRIHYKTGALESRIENSLRLVESSMFGCSGITDSYQTIRDDISDGVHTGDIKVENVDLDDILLCFVKEG